MPATLQSVPANSVDAALDYIRKGGRLAVATRVRVTVIDAKALAKFDSAGVAILKAEGNGYRLRSGKSSVYLLPGQLAYVVE